MELPSVFLELAKVYQDHGFSLFLIGGSSRDLLLGLPLRDYDFVTDATPDQQKAFLLDADYAFARFGSVKVRFGGVAIDVTTLREEGEYLDSRHPSRIRFITSLQDDSFRRDFTINALYISAKGEVFDFHEGLKDLAEKRICFIGDPWQRIREDPLRILRAERFAKRLGFTIEEHTAQAMEELRGELGKISEGKVSLEKKKE